MIFSRSHLHKKIDSALNTPLELLTIFAKGSILMFDWVLDTPLTCLKKDKNCEKPVKELFLNAAAKSFLRNFWEKLYWEMIFFTVIFSKFCKKSRSSHQRCSIKKAVLNNFAIFTGKHVSESLFNKIIGLPACNLIKKRLQHRSFSVNIVKFLITLILKNTCKQPLL